MSSAGASLAANVVTVDPMSESLAVRGSFPRGAERAEASAAAL